MRLSHIASDVPKPTESAEAIRLSMYKVFASRSRPSSSDSESLGSEKPNVDTAPSTNLASTNPQPEIADQLVKHGG